MIEKFKESIDRGHQFGALLTDLSKEFDCIHHKILIPKLYSHGISLSSIKGTLMQIWKSLYIF